MHKSSFQEVDIALPIEKFHWRVKKHVTTPKPESKPITQHLSSYFVKIHFNIIVPFIVGQSRVVVRLTTGWTVRESNPGWGQDFLHASRPALGPSEPHLQLVRISLLGDKAAGARRCHSPPSSAKVKQRVELYVYSSSGGHGHCWGKFSLLTFTAIYKQAFSADLNILKLTLTSLRVLWILITFETFVSLAALYVVDRAATDVATPRVVGDALPVRLARFI
jgi:hypothetical protein